MTTTNTPIGEDPLTKDCGLERNSFARAPVPSIKAGLLQGVFVGGQPSDRSVVVSSVILRFDTHYLQSHLQEASPWPKGFGLERNSSF